MASLLRPIKTTGTRQYQTEYANGQQFAKDIEVDNDLDTIYNAWNTQIPPGLEASGITSTPAVKGVWVGAQFTTVVGLTTTPVELASVVTDANEDPNRWSLVLCQTTLQVLWGGPSTAPQASFTLAIRRGSTDVQTRIFTYGATTMGAVDSLKTDIPFTMVRIAKPGDAANVWRLVATLNAVSTGGIVINRAFAQIHTIQFN